jgi:DNA repair exonuclease SbcCD nuclease subunit
MKRLFFSDLHLHTWPYGAQTLDSGFNSRLWAQRLALQEMIKYIDEHNIRYAYFTGDLFHTHANIPTQALAVAGEFFKQLKSRDIKVRAIPGNHDFATRSGNINALHWLPNDVMNGTWFDGVGVCSLPYTDNEETIKRFLGEMEKQPDGTIVMLHQGVAGVPLSSGFLMDEKLTPDMVPTNVVAFTGHYHFFRRVTTNLTVVGNLTPLNWNDIDQQKGWVIYDDETRTVEQIRQTAAPEFRLVGRDHRECGASFVRVGDAVSSGEQEEVRQGLIASGALTVEFVTTTSEEGAKGPGARSGEEVTLAHLVKSFEAKDMEPRRREVGQQVRENSYAIPNA